jgi:hypothetical protein
LHLFYIAIIGVLQVGFIITANRQIRRNKMKTNLLKKITTIAVAVVALCAIAFEPTIANAQSGSGAGKLIARGRGFARFSGDGAITISGAGLLVIRPSDGNDEWNVSGKGIKRETKSGDVVYRGFDGTATITGTNVIVSITGANIRFDVEGEGRYFLRGRGVYSATNSTNHSWVGAERELK